MIQAPLSQFIKYAYAKDPEDLLNYTKGFTNASSEIEYPKFTTKRTVEETRQYIIEKAKILEDDFYQKQKSNLALSGLTAIVMLIAGIWAKEGALVLFSIFYFYLCVKPAVNLFYRRSLNENSDNGP